LFSPFIFKIFHYITFPLLIDILPLILSLFSLLIIIDIFAITYYMPLYLFKRYCCFSFDIYWYDYIIRHFRHSMLLLFAFACRYFFRCRFHAAAFIAADFAS